MNKVRNLDKDMARGSKVQPIDIMAELDKIEADEALAAKKAVSEEVLKEYYINQLSQLFKRDVLVGPVYTLDLLKTLYREHIGGELAPEFV